MSLTAFALVMFAALLHATWNAFVKINGDRVLFMAVLAMGSGLGAMAALPFLPLPDSASWPYLFWSVVLHQAYIGALLLAYRFGDLSHVYPLARGSAPLIVALVATTFVGEHLGTRSLVAVGLVGFGIMSLAFTRGGQNLRNPKAAFFGVCTGLCIAGYTLVDGIGARLAGSPHSYSAWLFALDWIPITVVAVLMRGRRAIPAARAIWRPGLVMGLLSLAAYWIVIWAMTVAPIALVAAVRETSIVFAVLIGVLILKEPLSLARLASTAVALGGVILLKTGRS